MDVQLTLVSVLVVLSLVISVIVVMKRSGRVQPVDGASEEALEDEITRYRAAVRANTLCARCGQANPPASKYCHECGRTLPAVDAQEFDGPAAVS